MSKDKKINKVVLAYSGGLDTSVILKWLEEKYECEVVTFTADLGQGAELNDAKEKANLEAEKIITSAKEQIVNEKMKAITELKNSVAILSIDIAEKILKSELSDTKKHNELITF